MLHTRQHFCDACSLVTCIAPAKPRQGTSSAPDGRLAPVDNLGIAICGQLEALEVEADADHVEGIVVHQPAVSHVLNTRWPSIAQVRPADSTPETAASAAPEHPSGCPKLRPAVVNQPGRAALAWPYGPYFRQRRPLAQVVLEAHEQLAHLVHLDIEVGWMEANRPPPRVVG